MYCGQTVGRIKMKLDMNVCLGPDHIVLDGDPTPPPQKGAEPRQIFGSCLLWPDGCMDQDATWYGGRPRPRPHCGSFMVTQLPLPEKGHSPKFLAHVYCGQNGWMDQNVTWYDGRPRPRPHCVTWGPKWGTAPPQFSADVYCGQTVAHLSYC